MVEKENCKMQIFSFYILLFLGSKSLGGTREVGLMNSCGISWLFSLFAKEVENSLSLIVSVVVNISTYATCSWHSSSF